MTWYNSYTGFPYKHLGDDTKTGIDCFNLCRLVYKEKLNNGISLSVINDTELIARYAQYRFADLN